MLEPMDSEEDMKYHQKPWEELLCVHQTQRYSRDGSPVSKLWASRWAVAAGLAVITGMEALILKCEVRSAVQFARDSTHMQHAGCKTRAISTSRFKREISPEALRVDGNQDYDFEVAGPPEARVHLITGC